MSALFEPELLSDGSTICVLRARPHVPVRVSDDAHYRADTSDIVQQGKTRLHEWAKWQRGASGAGYPTIEAFFRLVTPTSPDAPLGPLPADVAETDRAVCVLRFRTAGMLWGAVEQFFLCDDDVRVKCRRLGKSRAGFYRLVDRACGKVMRLILESWAVDGVRRY